jgi:hypothetical protein
MTRPPTCGGSCVTVSRMIAGSSRAATSAIAFDAHHGLARSRGYYATPSAIGSRLDAVCLANVEPSRSSVTSARASPESSNPRIYATRVSLGTRAASLRAGTVHAAQVCSRGAPTGSFRATSRLSPRGAGVTHPNLYRPCREQRVIRRHAVPGRHIADTA